MNHAVINAETGGPDSELHESQTSSKESTGESVSSLCSSCTSEFTHL